MSVSAHFSVATAAVLVVGGIAAFALATAIALKSSEREQKPGHAARVGVPPSSASAAVGAVPRAGELQGEYLLDVSELGEPTR